MARIIKFTDNKYFNIDERMLYIGGEPVGTELKGIPFRILVYLAKNSPIFLNQDQIIEECWNNDHCEGSVPYHIMMLRRKIQDKKIYGTRNFVYIIEADGMYKCSCPITDTDENKKTPKPNIKREHTTESNNIQYNETINEFETSARSVRNGLLNAVLYCNCKWAACTFDMESQHTNTCEGLLALLSCNEHHNHTDILDECLSILSDALNENGLPSKSLGIATVVPTSMYLYLSSILKSKIDMNVVSQLSNKLYESRENSGWGIYVKKMGRNTNIGCTYWAMIGLLSSGVINNDLIQKFIVSLFKYNGTYCFGRNIDEVNPRIPCLYSTSMMYILYSYLSFTNKELVNKRYDYRKTLEIIIKQFDNPFFLIEEEGIQGVEIPNRINVHTVNWNHITIHYSLKALSIAMYNNQLSQPEIIDVLGRISHLFKENCQLDDGKYYWNDPRISIEKGVRGKLIFPTMHAIMGLSSIIDYVHSVRNDDGGVKDD